MVILRFGPTTKTGRRKTRFLGRARSKLPALRCTRFLFCLLFISSVTSGTLFVSPALADELVIDGFDYTDAAAARAAWYPGNGSPPVDVTNGGPWGDETLTRFDCDYSQPDRDRCYWDRLVNLDLTTHSCFALRFHCSNPGPMGPFTLFFHSPGGWYGESVLPGRPGWNILVFQKEHFEEEGSPAGWDQIDAVRLSPWRNVDEDTLFHADKLWACTPEILVVKGTKTEAAYGIEVDAYSDPWVEWFNAYGLPAALVTDEDVENKVLSGAALAVLPYNPVMTEAEICALEAFSAGGGSIIACYVVDSRITDLLGLTQDLYNDTDVRAMNFIPGLVEGMPERVGQQSWNFIEVTPADPDTRILATWEDTLGSPLPHPAWLDHPAGAYCSHVLLSDDILNKQQMLMALLGHHLPQYLPAIAGGSLDRMGEVALFTGFDEAFSAIQSDVPASLHPVEASAALDVAVEAHVTAEGAWFSGQFHQVPAPAFEARRSLIRAYALCRLPEQGEFRAVWNHTGTGPWPGDWARSAHQLRQCGFTAVFPNMMSGGMAHFDSALLPHSETYKTYGDQIVQALAACRVRGIEMHVWKVNWNLHNAPQWFVDDMRSQERTQVDVQGNDIDWLCPSHPDNLQLEIDTMLEVVAGYDVDGIHFDYIRYPDGKTCYCDGCRLRFQAWFGGIVPNWPEDCYSGVMHDEYRDWRALQITTLVQQVSEQARALDSDIAISAAVFANYPECREERGQDWIHWIEQGYLDFVQPMDYTDNAYGFADIIDQQMDQVAGAVPVYPGIGATASSTTLPLDQVIVQILETRGRGTGGFTIFDYGSGLAEEILPGLDLGTTYPELTIAATLSCVPSTGTLPFSALFNATVENDSTGHRRIQAGISVTLANGNHYANWRRGTINNLPSGDSYSRNWSQPLPAVGSLHGDNLFLLTALDVTPAPYNQPPYPPSGDTVTDGCTVAGTVAAR